MRWLLLALGLRTAPMDRRRFLCGVGGAVTTGLAGCTAPWTGPDASTVPGELANPGFEDGLLAWVIGRDLPLDPNTGDYVASRARAATDVASDGERSCELFLDGRQDDGTIWAQQAVDLTGITQLSVDVYSPEESFNTITKVAAFAGPRPDRGYLREEHFDTSRAVEDHAGWETFEYPIDYEGVGLVAAGISVVWETEVTRYVDRVQLS